jgi:16S rRNA C967 or C1407 C5-methylase (RsmB/RsmF family)
MMTRPAQRTIQEKRTALWQFEQLATLQQRIIQRAGRLIRPQGRLTLSMSANSAAQNELLQYLDQLEKAA